MRRLIAAAVLLLAAPLAADAQSAEPELRPRVRVSPYFGFRIGYGESGTMTLTTPDTATAAVFETNSDGAAAAGLEADVRVWGPWSVVAGIAFAGADLVELRTGFDNGESVTLMNAPRLGFAKLGVALRLREPEPDFRLHRPTASIFVAPAMVWVDPPNQDLPGELDDAYDQWAVNFGFKGDAPLWSRNVLLHIGAEDYFTFWRSDRPADRTEQLSGDPDLRVRMDFDPSHVIVLRAGLSFSF